jgi:hypothetical protein
MISLRIIFIKSVKTITYAGFSVILKKRGGVRARRNVDFR